MQAAFASATMISGLVMIAAGYFSESLLPNEAIWNEKQAREHLEKSAKFHAASYAGHDHSQGNSHAEADRKSPEYLEAKAAFDKSAAGLQQAFKRRAWIKYGLIFAGVLVTGAGIVPVCLTRMAEDELPARHRSR